MSAWCFQGSCFRNVIESVGFHIVEHLGWETACGISFVCHALLRLVEQWFGQVQRLAFYNYRASDVVMGTILVKCSSLRRLKVVRHSDDVVRADELVDPFDKRFLLTDKSVEIATLSCKLLEHVHLEVALSAKSIAFIAKCSRLKSLTVKHYICSQPNAYLEVMNSCRELREIKLTHSFGDKCFQPL